MANFHPSANTNISIKWSTKIKCLSQTRLDTYKFSLPCTCAVVFCCPVFPFEATMTLAGLNVTLCRWKCAAKLVGPRPNRVNKIQNGRPVNKEIRLVGARVGVQELKGDNAKFDKG